MQNQLTHSIVFNPRSNMCEWISTILPQLTKDKDYLIEIRPYNRKRSNPQNRYLWGVVYPLIGNTLGYDTETVHEVLKQKFGVKQELRNNVTISISTTKYTTIQFEKYIEEITIFARDVLNIKIPAPNENEYYG